MTDYLLQYKYLILQVSILFIILMYFFFRKFLKNFHSHWNVLIPNFKYPSKDFYAALRKELLSHGIKGISTQFVNLKEGGVATGRRIYLRVTWKEYRYDMCCAPFGDGMFLSWWLIYKSTLGQIFVSRIPLIGTWLLRVMYPLTYYKIDTASMFMTYCHNTVLKIADDITKDSGLRIKDDERKPILQDIFKR